MDTKIKLQKMACLDFTKPTKKLQALASIFNLLIIKAIIPLIFMINQLKKNFKKFKRKI